MELCHPLRQQGGDQEQLLSQTFPPLRPGAVSTEQGIQTADLVELDQGGC